MLTCSPSSPSGSRKRKRGNYERFSPETKAKIARYAINHGASKAARYYSTTLNKNVQESTVRRFKTAYLLESKRNDGSPITALTPQKRGRPPLLGNLDEDVQDYIKDLRISGGIINTNIVRCIGRGVLLHKDKFQLEEFGGPVCLSKEWARSVLIRMNFTKRKATKGIKHKPDDFDKTKQNFLNMIEKQRSEYNIPNNLVFNWDQTGLNMIPQCSWTMEQLGARQVNVAGLGDKRQITALFCVTLDGHLLPPQLIYQGTTSMCHPNINFPDDWAITHSPNHWSTEETMLEYIEGVIVPYVEAVRENLPVAQINQPALAIFDVFAAHRSEKVLSALKKANIRYVFVPAGCTDELQPLDQTVNKKYKELLKTEFQNWYSEKVRQKLENQKPGENIGLVDIDMRTSTIKPLHAKWVQKVHDVISKDCDFLANSFTSVGINKI